MRWKDRHIVKFSNLKKPFWSFQLTPGRKCVIAWSLNAEVYCHSWSKMLEMLRTLDQRHKLLLSGQGTVYHSGQVLSTPMCCVVWLLCKSISLLIINNECCAHALSPFATSGREAASTGSRRLISSTRGYRVATSTLHYRAGLEEDEKWRRRWPIVVRGRNSVANKSWGWTNTLLTSILFFILYALTA